MKNKIIQRFFAVLLGLVMVGTASAGTSYCNEEIISTNGKKAYLSCTNPEFGKFVMEITSNEPNFTGLRGDNMWCHINDNGTTYHMTDNYTFVDGKVTFTIMASSVQDMYTPIYLNINNDECTFNSIQGKTFDWPTTCGGGDLTPSDLTITSSTDLELEVNATSQISHTTSSTGAVTYSSSNEGVATVSASGLITAHKGGKATITVAQAADDTYAACSKKITVTVPRTSQCSGDVGHFDNPSVKRIHYEIEYKDNAIEYTVTGLNSHAIDFLEVQTTKGNYAATITNGIGTYKQTGVTEGEDLGIRFLYSTDEIGGNEMNSENVNLDDPNIIYYKVGDCGAADPGLLTSDLTLTSEAEVEIAINATSQISYTTTSTGAVTYSSSKESVATVSNTGLITAIKGGKATITVSQAADATYNAGSLTVEVTVPEVITETTWWGQGSNNGVSILYSITRNLNKTLTFHVDAWGDVPNLQKPQIGFDGVGIFDMDADGNWTSTATYETDEVVNLFFYIPFTGDAARIDVAYTVGSEQIKPSIEVTGVSIVPSQAAIGVGETTSLTAIIKPAFATNTNISWSVIAGTQYASINANGVVTGLAAGAATVQVTTESGSKTATCDVNVVAQLLLEPDAAPDAPTHPAEKVKAVYSATYSADCGFGEWGGGTTYTQDTYGKKYVNGAYGYFGLVDFAHNCSQMEKLHLDVWAVTDITFRVVPIWTSTASQGVTVNIEGQKWNSIDLSLSEGAYAEVTDWSNVYQIKIDNAAYTTFWLNNVYFYTTATEMMCAVSATAGDGGSATASAASVASGTEVTFTATPDCGYEFASWTKGGEVIVGAGATYTTPITEETTLTANFNSTLTPATPTLDASNVMSVYGHYGNQTGLTVNPWWDYQTTQYNETTIGGETMARYTKINFQGMDFNANRMNVSDMQYVHLDLYASVESDIKFALIWQGGEHSVNRHLNGCAIESFDIPLSEFTGADLITIRQLKFDAQNLPLAGKTLIVQNIYFYAPNEFTLSETESNETNLEAFNGKACNVTIARSFTAGSLYTLALPFDMTEAQVEETFRACTMYALAESYWKVEGENMYIRFAPVTEFEAGTPILFTPTEDIENAVAKEVTIKNGDCETATTLVTFHGTYSKMDLDAPNYILAADQYLYPVVGDEYSINGMRGYFSFGASVPQAPKMARIILHEETTTDNAFLRNEKQEMRAKKVLENGRFVIIRDGARYGVLGVEE